MANKQIVIDYKTLCENYSKEIGCYNTFDGSCSKEECFTYRLLQLLQVKEKECEELNKQVEIFTRQLEKANKEVTKEKEKNAKQWQKNEKLEQTLAEIEPVLELYANSEIGEEQLDGTYKVIVECLSVPGGAYTIHYDPKPAKQALQKIRKV